MEQVENKQINLTVWVTTISVDRLYTPVRKQKLSDRINKQT